MSFSSYLNMIKELGLTEYEAKCYLALFERESLSAIEVMNLAGIPRPNTYEALKKLLAKGLCVSRPGKPKRFAASDPLLLKNKALAVVENSLDCEIVELEKRKNKILGKKKIIQENIDSAVAKLQVLYGNNRKNGSPLEYIEILKDAAQVQHKAVQLCLETKTEMLAFIRPPFAYASDDQEQDQIDAQSDALKHGVKIRVIHEIPADTTQKTAFFKRILKYTSPKRYEPRIIDSLPMKLAIYDEKIVFISLEDPIQGKPSMTILVAEHHALAKGLKEMFESYWSKAQDYFILNNRKYLVANPMKKTSRASVISNLGD